MQEDYSNFILLSSPRKRGSSCERPRARNNCAFGKHRRLITRRRASLDSCLRGNDKFKESHCQKDSAGSKTSTMLAFFTRQFRALAPMFRPPFDGLWIACLLYYFWCFLVHPQGQILRGNLPDPDDYMYLDQLLDWLKGQGWYDHIQHRLDPPEGGLIHFSRLPMIPM